LPPKIDATVRQRFDELIEQGKKIVQDMERDNHEGHARNRDRGVTFIGEIQHQDTPFHALITSTISLVNIILGATQRSNQIVEDLRSKKSKRREAASIIGILQGLKSDYEAGLLDNLPEIIEANVASDYMGQSEGL